jgi:uncharacterized protein (DUF1330 family)
MPAYLIANIDVHDRATFEAYRAQVPAVIASFGGRYRVRGGEVLPVEGDPGLKRVVILEFPSLVAARRFWDSPEYEPVKRLREQSATSHVALVDGMPPST